MAPVWRLTRLHLFGDVVQSSTIHATFTCLAAAWFR